MRVFFGFGAGLILSSFRMRSFLNAHWGQIAGIDFFITEMWTSIGRKTDYVLLLIDCGRHQVIAEERVPLHESAI